MNTRWTLVAAAVLLGGCGGDTGTRLTVERDTLGDTLVVRTVAGSQWQTDATLVPELRIGVFEGEDHYMFGRIRSLAVAPDGSIYAVDLQVPALRKYAPDGTYRATFGREGEGPGEYRAPDGGLNVLSDGRVVLRDPRNARIQVFSPEGEPLDTWPIRGNFNTSNPLVVDSLGRVYSQILLDPSAPIMEWRPGLVAFDSETGEPVDTIPAPEWEYEEPSLVAQSTSDGGGTSTSVSRVPFSPEGLWAFSPLGYMVGGLSTRYAIDQFRPDGTVLRMERVTEPLPVTGGEKANARDRAQWQMRQTQPDWTWDGSAIPDRKPPFRDIQVGRDGRIWVLLHTRGEPIPEDLVEPADDGPNPQPAERWREPLLFDVFEPDGTYLGQVSAPYELALRPTPIFGRDRVWAVVRDEFDVQYIVRYRIDFAATENATE